MTSITTYTPFIPDQYCVYHTTYSGTLLPQNYIGSTYVDRILIQNYHGSVASKRYKAIWESEIKLHPELFLTAIVSYHDTRPNATYKDFRFKKYLMLSKAIYSSIEPMLLKDMATQYIHQKKEHPAPRKD